MTESISIEPAIRHQLVCHTCKVFVRVIPESLELERKNDRWQPKGRSKSLAHKAYRIHAMKGHRVRFEDEGWQTDGHKEYEPVSLELFLYSGKEAEKENVKRNTATYEEAKKRKKHWYEYATEDHARQEREQVIEFFHDYEGSEVPVFADHEWVAGKAKQALITGEWEQIEPCWELPSMGVCPFDAYCELRVFGVWKTADQVQEFAKHYWGEHADKSLGLLLSPFTIAPADNQLHRFKETGNCTDWSLQFPFRTYK